MNLGETYSIKPAAAFLESATDDVDAFLSRRRGNWDRRGSLRCIMLHSEEVISRTLKRN
jgi:hypothetical protein